MKRDGFLLINILILLVIISVTATYLIDVSFTQNILGISYQDKVQADYLSEIKLNRLYYDDDNFESYIKPFVVNHMKYPTMTKYNNFSLNLDFNDDDIDGSIDGKFYMNNNRKYLELSTETNYNGFKSNMKVLGPVVKDLFETCNEVDSTFPLLSIRTCPNLLSYLEELRDSLEVSIIPSDLEGLFVFDYERVRVNSKSRTLEELHLERKGLVVTKTFDKNIFFIIKNELNKPIQLEVGLDNKFDPLRLSGIIYVEGDLVISGSFEFNGILILNGEDSKIIVNSPVKPIFNGIIFTAGEMVDLDSISLEYDKDYVYRYGVNLPGFIDPKVEVVKKY